MNNRTFSRAGSGRWFVVTLFAIAMAWVESAVVFYLRTMIDRIEPYQPNPLPEFGGLEKAELTRELATLVMLAAVGWLAGRNWRSRMGYFLVAFGVWDIFYYVFLKVLTGWPRSLLDWDILFLIPLPWWGGAGADVHRRADDSVGHAGHAGRVKQAGLDGIGKPGCSISLELRWPCMRSCKTRSASPPTAHKRCDRSCRRNSIGRCSLPHCS
jgi:hypothetical protein